MGFVCTVGVGALYLAPSLAGPPEQIAIPAPTEIPTIEPTPFETPFEEPTPFDTTVPEPVPTESTVPTVPDAPTNVPTTSYPTTEATIDPPYVPPEPVEPKKTKAPKPPKIELGSVVVTVSDITPEKFTAKWPAVSNTKKYDISGCGLKSKTISTKSQVFTFPSGKKCSFKVNASGSGSYKDGPTETTAVKPVYGQPKITTPLDGAYVPLEDFNVAWDGTTHASPTTKFEITTLCLHKKDDFVSPVEISFNGQTGCVISVKALGDADYSESAPSAEVKVKKGVAPTGVPDDEFTPGG